jgi:hypothetical protein
MPVVESIIIGDSAFKAKGPTSQTSNRRIKSDHCAAMNTLSGRSGLGIRSKCDPDKESNPDSRQAQRLTVQKKET